MTIHVFLYLFIYLKLLVNVDDAIAKPRAFFAKRNGERTEMVLTLSEINLTC